MHALIHQWVGILGWIWISSMNPHKLSREIEMFSVAALVGRRCWSGYIWHTTDDNS